MAEKQFTKGPWEANEETVTRIEARMAMIGEVYGGKDAECAANANLIAAAPDLYEAARAMVAVWFEATPPGTPGEGEAIEKLIAALAKADGRETE